MPTVTINEEALTDQVWTRITREEKEAVDRFAEQYGLTKSQFVRVCIRKMLEELDENK